jgi:hypothetical protein
MHTAQNNDEQWKQPQVAAADSKLSQFIHKFVLRIAWSILVTQPSFESDSSDELLVL